MPAQAKLDDDHPMMAAWEAYRSTEDGRNAIRWARHIEVSQGDALQGQIIVSHPHVTGSMGAAFVAGYEAAKAGPGIEELMTALRLVGVPPCCLGVAECDGSHYPDKEGCCAARRALQK